MFMQHFLLPGDAGSKGFNRTHQTLLGYGHGAMFSKLLRKVFGRFLFLGKGAHFRNFIRKHW